MYRAFALSAFAFSLAAACGGSSDEPQTPVGYTSFTDYPQPEASAVRPSGAEPQARPISTEPLALPAPLRAPAPEAEGDDDEGELEGDELDYEDPESVALDGGAESEETE